MNGIPSRLQPSFLLFVSLFSFSPTAPTLASASDLSDQNVADYVEFDDGTWWEYETTSTSYGGKINTRTVKIDGEATGFKGYIEDNVYYLSAYNGEDFNEPYIGFDLDGYSQEVHEDAYSSIGILEEDWGEVGDVTNSCEYTLESDQSVELDNGKDYEDTGIMGECTLEFKILKAPDGYSSLTGSTIEFAQENHYVAGLGLVSFKSIASVDGAFLAQVTSQLLSTSLLEDSSFTDVEVVNKNFAAIDYLYDEGILSGYSDGTFKPNNTVNRAELLKILVEGLGVTPDEGSYKNCFPDVGTDWYAKYVCYAKEKGWVSGYGDGFFRPADSVNKVESLKMLLNSQGIEIDPDASTSYEDFSDSEWFSSYVATAESRGILEENGSSFYPDQDRTRAEIAEELYRVLVYSEDLISF